MSSAPEPEEAGDVVELEPPRIADATFGLVQHFWRYRRHRKKLKKFAKKGYVRWHLVGDSFSRAKFVKPKAKGGGVRELEYDGETYLFPREAAAAGEENGMWTFVHRKGDADPVNLRDSVQTSIPAKALTEYLDMRVTKSPPSFLDSLSIDSQDAIKYAMAAIILLVAGQSVLGGGL